MEDLETIAERIWGYGRSVFMPIDLLVHYSQSDDSEELCEAIVADCDGAMGIEEMTRRLGNLAREIDGSTGLGEPRLHRDYFSRGFSRILEEAWKQAPGFAGRRGRAGVEEVQRALMWRIEAVESASIRWAMRRLDEGKGDALFDKRGLLKLGGFDETCTRMLEGAAEMAASQGNSFLGTPHLVAMMAAVRDSVIWRSASARGLEPRRLREELIRLIGTKPDPIPSFLLGRKTLTPRMIRMLQRATSGSQEAVSEADLVEAFLEDGGSSLELMQALGLEESLREALGEPRVLADVEPVEAAIRHASKGRATPTLEMLGRDLTEEALSGRLPQIVGRQRELRRVCNILMRREQRNPLLTGEAGVGKTALAVGLAQLIASGEAPAPLRDYRVVEINGASLVGGTSYRGDLEARISSLLEEASRQVILFVDEAHAVFSPRSGRSSPAEIPNHFKRALASGQIAVIGATTEDEYRRWFEQDPALKRRFERIDVEEPDRETVQHILNELIPQFESAYDVEVGEDAVDAAIELSTVYLPERRLPDKAKKVLMDACIARANPLGGDSARQEGDGGVVGRREVAEQIHLATSIPMERLLEEKARWWKDLDRRLKAKVIGQDRALEDTAHLLVASRLRKQGVGRPLATMVFSGPAGVGKKETARTLAEEVYGDQRALLSIDMSDFQQSHALSRLIGSPPGYVGYEDQDCLVTPLRQRPGRVILLESFDRAHHSIQDRLLKVIESGEIVDTQGHRADASHAIFVLTLDGRRGSASSTSIGFGARSADRRDGWTRLEAQFSSTLVERLRGRVDGVVEFRSLDADPDAGSLAVLEARLGRLCERVEQEYDLNVEVSEELKTVLERRVGQMSTVAAIDAVVEEEIMRPLARYLLGARESTGLVLGWDGDEIAIDGS